MTHTLSRRALNRATLARQLLLRRDTLKPGAAVWRIGGIQAQLPRLPFVALWSRLEDFRRDSLIHAIQRAEVVRGTLMRATLHLVWRQDYIDFRVTLQSVLSRAMASVLKERTAGANVARITAAARAFFFENPRTFEMLRESLVKRFPDVDERALGYLVRMNLPLIMVPAPGEKWAYPAQAAFTLAERWLNEVMPDEPYDEAIAGRYFTAFGPAGIDDFASWSGLANAREIVEQLRPQLATFRDERGRELFDLPNAPRPDADEPAPARFLPEFDNVLLGYGDRARIVDEAYRPMLATRNLLVPATFLVDGFITGLWSAANVRGTATLTIKPFRDLSPAVRDELAAEADGMLRFLEPEAVKFAIEFEPAVTAAAIAAAAAATRSVAKTRAGIAAARTGARAGAKKTATAVKKSRAGAK